MPAAGYLLIGFAAGLVLGFLLGLVRRNRSQEQRLKEIEARLNEDLSRSTREMTARVESALREVRLAVGRLSSKGGKEDPADISQGFEPKESS